MKRSIIALTLALSAMTLAGCSSALTLAGTVIDSGVTDVGVGGGNVIPEQEPTALSCPPGFVEALASERAAEVVEVSDVAMFGASIDEQTGCYVSVSADGTVHTEAWIAGGDEATTAVFMKLAGVGGGEGLPLIDESGAQVRTFTTAKGDFTFTGRGYVGEAEQILSAVMPGDVLHAVQN